MVSEHGYSITDGTTAVKGAMRQKASAAAKRTEMEAQPITLKPKL